MFPPTAQQTAETNRKYEINTLKLVIKTLREKRHSMEAIDNQYWTDKIGDDTLMLATAVRDLNQQLAELEAA